MVLFLLNGSVYLGQGRRRLGFIILDVEFDDIRGAASRLLFELASCQGSLGRSNNVVARQENQKRNDCGKAQKVETFHPVVVVRLATHHHVACCCLCKRLPYNGASLLFVSVSLS